MPCILLPLWVVTTIFQWVFIFRGESEWASSPASSKATLGRYVIILGAIPPTMICLVSVFVLLFSAPTVQFNVGNSFAMELWSFWVHWWGTIYTCAAVQGICYFLWGILSLVTPHSSWMRGVVLCAFLSSVWGWLLLSKAFPSA